MVCPFDDTGEGGISAHHLAGGGDLMWELGAGYFGARTSNSDFDPREFVQKTAHPAVTVIEALRIMASLGVSSPRELRPEILRRNMAERERFVCAVI